MKILWKGTSRQLAGAAIGVALSMAGAPGYGSAVDAVPTPASNNCQCAADTYAIVNLVPGIGYRTRVNARGKAAFEFVSFQGRLRVGFFDGERMQDISPPGAEVAALGDMNAKSEVTAYAALPAGAAFNLFPFRWSRAAGWTPLPVLSADWDSFTGAINDRGVIAGASGIGPGEEGYRAVRWSAANRLLPLQAGAGFGESIASDINEHDVTAGYAYTTDRVPRTFIWDAAGRPTDLGTFGAAEAAGLVNNNRGEIAGWLNFSKPDFQAFLWSPGKGAARVGLHAIPGELNNVGELVGRVFDPDTGIDHAYVFSRARGLVDLHRAPFMSSDASQADDAGTVIGEMFSNSAGDFAQRAYRWSRSGQATDLNTRLLNVPDGLIVTQALRIAPSGDIIANSTAGLLLLSRSGGTDAPVLGPALVPDVVVPTVPFAIRLSFRDRNKTDTHSATVDWGDGSGVQVPAISERMGRGELSASHTYACAGDYNVVVRVVDSTGRATVQARQITIFPPLIQGIVGEGNLRAALPGAGQATLAFRLAAPLSLGKGQTPPFTFVLTGSVAFKGEQLERVSRNGNTISLEGTGKLRGQPGYRFRIEARDGQHGGTLAADRLAVRIEHAAARGKEPAVLSYGVADGSGDAGMRSREGILPPTALRLTD